jgi:hypothetical protein
MALKHMPDGTQRELTCPRRNNRKNTAEIHFMAPVRGVVLSARNR